MSANPSISRLTRTWNELKSAFACSSINSKMELSFPARNYHAQSNTKQHCRNHLALLAIHRPHAECPQLPTQIWAWIRLATHTSARQRHRRGYACVRLFLWRELPKISASPVWLYAAHHEPHHLSIGASRKWQRVWSDRSRCSTYWSQNYLLHKWCKGDPLRPGSRLLFEESLSLLYLLHYLIHLSNSRLFHFLHLLRNHINNALVSNL